MTRAIRSRFSPVMRCTASLVSLALIVSFVLAAPLQARAGSIRAAKASLDAANAAARYSAPVIKPRLIPPPKSLKENLAPLTAAQIAKLSVKSKSNADSSGSITLLDAVGRLKQQPPTAVEVNRSARTFAACSRVVNTKAIISAYTHLIHGELLLARDEEPDAAAAEFRTASRLAVGESKASRTIRETADFDVTFALFYSGQYQPAADHLQHILKSNRTFAAISRRDAALFLRHAQACAGYHAERSKAGIAEPTRIAPLCGIEAIAAWLRANGRPFDKKSVLPTCRVTGEGSSLADLEKAADKLGLRHFVFAADAKGLMALPKPMVAFVEHDHFVGITSADEHGVTYLCADCGLWPGGQQHVSWKQWRMMEGGPYMALAVPGSDIDKALTLASAAAQPDAPTHAITSAGLGKTNGLRLASAGGQSVSAAAIARLAARLKGHLVIYAGYAQAVTCGGKPAAGESGGGGGCGGASCPTDGSGQGSGSVAVQNVGPSAGDPVNLATGEEDYEPAADLTVYNPIGPSVSFSRMYSSLRPLNAYYNSDDFGVGWSHSYNYMMYDPTTKPLSRYQQGSSNSYIMAQGNDAPTSGMTWDIVQNGTVVATSSVPNGWTLFASGPVFSMTVPSGASVGTGYEARYNVGGFYGFQSFFFDVYASGSTPQVPQGGTASFTFSGHDAPAGSLTWDIIQGGTTFATSTSPNGWSATPSSVGAPVFAAPGTYEARYHVGGPMYMSSYFQVYEVDYNPKAGTRYLIEPNGSQVSVTAYSVPTAASPTVACVLQAGYPMIVTWNYAAGYTCGYYDITLANREQIVTTTEAKAVASGTAIFMLVGQIIDQSGNYISFNYGAAGAGGFAMLASITDSNGAALVTFSRTSGSGNLTAINDRYGRSVYYGVGTFATANVPSGYAQNYQEVSTISQIVATGTGSPPNRYAYGYQDVANGEGSEQVPFLHTITVPSPTGTGNATSTINYATNGTCYVTSTVDANGNSHIYTATNTSTTTITIEDVHGTVDYTYSVTFDTNMSETGRTNGAGVYQTTNTFGDPNDPYRASEITNANGNTSYATWDQYGNCLTSTSARGTVTTFTYSYANFALGELTGSQIGAKTASTCTYYEPSGQLESAATAAPGTASSGANVTNSYSYDSAGDVLTTTGPGNNATSAKTTTFGYTTDGTYSQSLMLGRPIVTTDNLSHSAHARYDSRGNMTSASDSFLNETDVVYNLADQVVSITFPATGETGAGRASLVYTYLYPGGPKTQETQYNESGVQIFQVIRTLGAEGEELARSGSTQPYSAVHDGLYRIVSASDGNSSLSQFYYSTAGYKWKMAYPNGDTFEFTSFDNLGDPTQRVDGRGVVTNYLYSDPESKLTDVEYPATPAANVHLSYDGYARGTGMTDGTGSQGWTFDDRDNTLSATTTYTGLSAQAINYAYYPDNSRESLILPDSTMFSYTYDAGGRPAGLTNSTSQTWAWSYVNNSWMSGQNANNVVITTPTRDARGLITAISNNLDNIPLTLLSNSNAAFTSASTTYQVTTSIPAAPSSFSGTTSYTFDTKLQLTQEQSTRGGTYTNNFGFDGAGNPTTFKGGSNTFNNANQNTANGYDGNGNPTTYAGQTLAYDVENRMTAFGGAMTAAYHGDGKRAWKSSSSGTTYYFYDGDQLVLEENGSGTKTAVNTFGPNGLLARSAFGSSPRTLLYTFDAQGNVAQQVDASLSTVVASYMFDAFGTRSVSSTDSEATSEPFTGFLGCEGYYTDWETGLALLGYRYYDRTTGRFLTRDPISYAGGVNVYEYVGNSPTKGSDPTGLDEFTLPEWPNGVGTIPSPDVPGGSIIVHCQKCAPTVGIGECFGDLVGAITQIGMSYQGSCTIASAICKLATGCLASLGVASMVLSVCKPMLLAGNPALAIGCACGIGALFGLTRYVSGAMCDGLLSCEPNNPNIGNICSFGNAVANGCADGIGDLLGGWAAYLLHGIIGAVEGAIDKKLCDHPSDGAKAQ